MMSPEKTAFYVYAETRDEVRDLEATLHDLVERQYRKGSLVTARKLTELIRRFGDSFWVTQYLQ